MTRGQRADVRRAAEILEEWASVLEDSHTSLEPRRPWMPDSQEAKAEHDEIRALAARLRGYLE